MRRRKRKTKMERKGVNEDNDSRKKGTKDKMKSRVVKRNKS